MDPVRRRNCMVVNAMLNLEFLPAVRRNRRLGSHYRPVRL